MKYIDIFKKAYTLNRNKFGFSSDTRIDSKGYWGLNDKVLAWASHHEHAVFNLPAKTKGVLWKRLP